MYLIRTFVAPSPVHGVGLFAKDLVAAGTRIWTHDPRFDIVFARHEIDEFPNSFRELFETYAYPHGALDNRFILELDNGRFMNHSAEPNTNFANPGEGWATRDIMAGEELTSDYSEIFENFDGTFGSHPPLVQAKYLESRGE